MDINSIISFLNDKIWAVIPPVLIGTGIFFMVVTRAVQFRYFTDSFKSLFSGKHNQTHDEVNISPLQSFMTGLASRVGMGNIAGVATAIVAGGEGAVFWMWVAAIIGMASAFAESALAQLYKTKNKEGVFVGGPAFYIAQGLKLPVVGIVFSIFLAFTYGLAFNSIQANQIAVTVESNFAVSRVVTGLVVTALTAIVIFGSLKLISNVSGKVVSIMAVLYILIGILVITINYDQIIPALEKIVVHAFTGKAAAGATLGLAIQYGIKRGLFSNEAGMGSAPNIAASASTLHPADQGFVQMIGVFFDTIVICTFTALIIITTGLYEQEAGAGLNGAALTTASITQTLTAYAKPAMAIIVFLFAFSSIIGNFAYAISGLKYFTNSKLVRNVFAVLVCAFVYIGSVSEQQTVWDFSDVFMGGMTLINCVAILLLWKQVKLIIDDYARQKGKGVEHPEFNSDLYPVLRDKIAHQSIWSRKRDESYDSNLSILGNKK